MDDGDRGLFPMMFILKRGILRMNYHLVCYGFPMRCNEEFTCIQLYLNLSFFYLGGLEEKMMVY